MDGDDGEGDMFEQTKAFRPAEGGLITCFSIPLMAGEPFRSLTIDCTHTPGGRRGGHTHTSVSLKVLPP
jgi:hypothetical protein